ncbi:50S ribosomal protein L29 [Patescibacteria group bacterium]|nr:50S ribosomal protein L29 [Patescibacteria group bacterium]
MELDKLRKLSEKDLAKEIAKLQDKLIQLQAEVAMHKAKNFRALRSARRDLARLLTIKNEQSIIKEVNHE